MTARDAFEFVFGGDGDLAAWEAADSDGRLELVAERFGMEERWPVLLRSFVVGQMLEGDPPEVWATARRLAAGGLDLDRVLNQISLAYTQTMIEGLEDGEELSEARFDVADYRARLDLLPLPDHDEIVRALLDVARSGVVTPVDELDAAVLRILHGDAGDSGDAVTDTGQSAAGDSGEAAEPAADNDETVLGMVQRVFEQLVADFGPLAFLPGDDVVHVDALCDGIVLTHRLTDAERKIGALDVSFDLAGFGHVDEPVLALPDGDTVPLEPITAEPGHLAWAGPDGWLDRFEPGTVLAVRRGTDGRLTFEPLDAEPATDPDLAAAVRRAYDEDVAEPGLPVSGRDLLIGVIAEARARADDRADDPSNDLADDRNGDPTGDRARDRGAFAVPQATLTSLCAEAGLELRGSQVAHEPTIWANDESARRSWRILDQTDDIDFAETVMRVLATCDLVRHGGPVDDAAVREALDILAEIEALAIAQDELVDPEHVDTLTVALVERLLAVADTDARRAVARLLAARHAEAEGDLAAAEQHLELSLEADADFVPALDHLAWYASDRGDAARAARLWGRCGQVPTIQLDLATIEPFTRPAAALGRNDPCWCGSGRKHKQCHLGRPAPAPLPDRVRWLCRKAADYLARSGIAAQAAVMSVADVRAGDDGDIDEALDDPLVIDLVLTERGWFERFLADRGDLLPDDEAQLVASWSTVARTVYEVTDVDAGTGLTVRDLATGDRTDVRERTFSHHARPGELVCARAVPDGAGHQFVGGLFPVRPGDEDTVLEMLAEDDPFEIAAWVRESLRPPELLTSGNGRLVRGEAL